MPVRGDSGAGRDGERVAAEAQPGAVRAFDEDADAVFTRRQVLAPDQRAEAARPGRRSLVGAEPRDAVRREDEGALGRAQDERGARLAAAAADLRPARGDEARRIEAQRVEVEAHRGGGLRERGLARRDRVRGEPGGRDAQDAEREPGRQHAARRGEARVEEAAVATEPPALVARREALREVEEIGAVERVRRRREEHRGADGAAHGEALATPAGARTSAFSAALARRKPCSARSAGLRLSAPRSSSHAVLATSAAPASG